MSGAQGDLQMVSCYPVFCPGEAARRLHPPKTLISTGSNDSGSFLEVPKLDMEQPKKGQMRLAHYSDPIGAAQGFILCVCVCVSM